MTMAGWHRRMAPSSRAWWRQRSPRERALLGAMAVAALVYLVAVVVFQPMLAARAEARDRIARADAGLARLASLGDEPARMAAPTADRPVNAVVTETATEFGLTIRRIEPEGDGVRMTIEDADFADIVRWIDEVETRQGLRVTAAEMDRRPEPGVVSASLTVLR